ncbi:hypothetical protein [Peribacillus loiseleuriae]|uniref:hypothetical protein n=1 Tax=Peribacillus loiseleuriae TaxID=1679170 RepID=UPI003D057648
MKDDIQFLKDLQGELRTQDNDCQASPRYWTVGDYKMVGCPEGNQDTYHVGLPNRDYYDDLEELLKEIKDEIEESDEYSDEAKEEFNEIECEDSAMDWIKEHYDEDAYLIPVREEHIIHPNTMFLTKVEAKRHIELNHYHYTSKAHTYAMTAWRAPKVERLLKILETFDWNKIDETSN